MIENELSTKEKKVAVKAELVMGGNARKLAEKYGLHYTTVIGYRNELREGETEAEVLDVADTDAHILHMVADELKAKVVDAEVLPPKGVKDFGTKVDSIVDGICSLQLLSTEFHNTVTILLQWANGRITPDMPLAEWRAISSQVGELHKAVYAQGGMQVNVQQNNGASSFSSGMVN